MFGAPPLFSDAHSHGPREPILQALLGHPSSRVTGAVTGHQVTRSRQRAAHESWDSLGFPGTGLTQGAVGLIHCHPGMHRYTEPTSSHPHQSHLFWNNPLFHRAPAPQTLQYTNGGKRQHPPPKTTPAPTPAVGTDRGEHTDVPKGTASPVQNQQVLQKPK